MPRHCRRPARCRCCWPARGFCFYALGIFQIKLHCAHSRGGAGGKPRNGGRAAEFEAHCGEKSKPHAWPLAPSWSAGFGLRLFNFNGRSPPTGGRREAPPLLSARGGGGTLYTVPPPPDGSASSAAGAPHRARVTPHRHPTLNTTEMNYRHFQIGKCVS